MSQRTSHMGIRIAAVVVVCALLGIMTLVATSIPRATAAPLLLANEGQTDYQIVIPAETDVSTKAVAEDFADILKQITGATFPVVADTQPPQPKEIVVGENNARLGVLGVAGIARGFAQGEYEIRTIGQRLIIAGGPPRGTINGMYGFLQDHLGCRWFTPGVSRIPQRSRLQIDPIRDRQRPAFRYRSMDPPMHWDAAWTARNRLNECKTYGGTVSMMMLMSDPRVQTIGNYSSGHQFSYIPASLYEEHPEYYALIDGQRRLDPDPNQRAYCLTNEGFVQYMADMLKRSLRGTSGPHFVGLGHADNSNYCQCPNCRASYDRVGVSGTYMEFDNKVARAVAKEYPNAIISTLAYGVSFAPTDVKMEPNIRPLWCPISACYAHGFDECAYNRDRDWLGQLAKWLENTSQLGIWYYHHQADSLMPHLNLFATKRNFAIFRDMGVDDIFVECNVGGTRRTNPVSDGDKLLPAYGDAERNGYFTVPWALEHLRGYITCRLLWNPDFDVEQGIREFCQTYYGPAGDELAQYALTVESIDSYGRNINRTFAAYADLHENGSNALVLKWPIVQQMDALFDRAEAKVADDAVLLRRVQMARLSLQLEILCFAPADSPLRQKAFDGFFPLAEELGIMSLYRTGVTMERQTIPEFKELMTHPEALVIPGEEPVGANVLVNSDFETDADGDGLPDGWSATGKYLPEDYTLDPRGVALTGVKACSGVRSVKLTKGPATKSTVALRQRFAVTVGERYRASVHYQADVQEGGVYIIFTAFDKNGKWLQHQGGARGINSTGDQWEELTADTKVEEGTGELMIEFLFYDDQAEGVAWIDDFTCRKILKK